MRDILINLILVAILAFFVMQVYQTYKNQEQTLEQINLTLRQIDLRLTQFETN